MPSGIANPRREVAHQIPDALSSLATVESRDYTYRWIATKENFSESSEF